MKVYDWILLITGRVLSKLKGDSMVRQDDEILNRLSKRPLKEYGCALFDILYLAVMYGSYSFTRQGFLNDVENWVRSGVLDKNMTVLDWDRLASDAGLPYRIVIENGTHKLPKERKLKSNELQILYLHNPKTGFSHFVVGTEDNNIAYDSLGESVTGKAFKEGTGYIKSKRVLRRIS